MARYQKTSRAYAMLATASMLSVGVSVAAGPCEEAMNRIWSVEDATSFEAIESQVFALIANASPGANDGHISFPDEEGC